MRIVAGAARGRRLAVPPGAGTRPTSDRAREGLFSTLHSLYGPLDGARVLDLFGGSGALALEALSRGADTALIVEADPRAVAVIRANIDAVGLPGARVLRGRAERLAAALPDAADAGRCDVVFADPPYAMDRAALAAVLRDLVTHGWLAANAVAVVERDTRDAAWVWPDGFVGTRSRRYGAGTLWYGRAAGADVPSGPVPSARTDASAMGRRGHRGAGGGRPGRSGPTR